MSAPLVLGDRRRQLQDRPRARARATASVLALVRGPLSSPHHLGLDGCAQRDRRPADRGARRAPDSPNGAGPVADVGQLLLAGVDFPSEVDEMQQAAAAHGGFASAALGRQRHPRRPARRHRAGLGRRRRLRRRDQLRRRRPRRAAGSLPGARLDAPATGAAGYDVGLAATIGRGPQRGRARREDDPRARGPGALRARRRRSQLAEAAPRGPDRAAPRRSSSRRSSSPRPSATPPPRRSSTACAEEVVTMIRVIARAARADATSRSSRARRRAHAVGRRAADRRGQGRPR